MSVGFFLKDKKKSTTYINTIVAFKGKYFKRSTGESIQPRSWSDSMQRCKESGFPAARRINKTLNEIFVATTQACDYFVEHRAIPSQPEFWERVDFFLSGGKITASIGFVDYLKSYINDRRGRLAARTVIKYNTLLNKLTEYEFVKKRKLRFEDIDINFYHDFERWIYTYQREDGTVGYTANYFGALIQCLKVVFRGAKENGLHNLTGIEHKDFKTVSETADTIYLNEDELLRIHRLNFTPELVLQHFPNADKRPQNMARRLEAYEIVRAKFLIGAYTALRVSDFNRLESVNLHDGFITIRTKKTGVKVVIPVHWVIREIIDRGFNISTPISEQKINKHIKEICVLADINDPVEITLTVGGRRIAETHPKWELVTNHTARRSGATNMYKAGIPSLSIMKITGHTTEKSFLKYIKITAEENALLLAQHSFFRRE